jgi:DnaJ domain/PilZ domain
MGLWNLGGASGWKRPRGNERFSAHDMLCALGTVMDLSRSGMRVRSDQKPPLEVGEVMPLTVGPDGQKIKVSGRVVWKKRRGWGSFEMGIKFVDLRPGMAEVLECLAQHGCVFSGSAGTGSKARPAEESRPKANISDRTLKAAMDIEDLYAVLGVSRHSTDEQIKQAYRTLAFKYHPDVTKDSGAAAQFTLISKSYSVLRNPDLRRRYDEMLDSRRVA